MRTRRVGALLAVLWLVGCASAPPPDARITGVALTRQPFVLAPVAVFEAALMRWERDGGPPTVLARQRQDEVGGPPYLLDLPYHQARIEPGARYRVRAQVAVNEQVLLATAQDVPVLLDPALRRADLLLTPVPPLPASAQAAVPLRQTWWRLTEIVDAPEAVGAPAAQAWPAHLLLQAQDARVSGSGGCNGFTGQYQSQGDRLAFTHLAASPRLCLDGGLSEAAFFERLPRVVSYWQQGTRLELRAGDGTPLLRLQAEERGLAPLQPAAAPVSP